MKNKLNVILTGTPSDSHTWNLIFMELFLEENGCKVRNLGACIATDTLHQVLENSLPDLVVISSINGHLFQDAMKIINTLPKELSRFRAPFVVGGKIGISDHNTHFQKKKLIQLGYQDAFIEPDSLPRFQRYLQALKKMKNQPDLKYAL